MATIKQTSRTTTTYKYRKSQIGKHCPVCGKFMSKGKSVKKK